MVEQGADAPRRPQVLVHDQPDAEAGEHKARQHRQQLRAPPPDPILAIADAEPGPQRREQAQVAGAAEAEAQARPERRPDVRHVLVAPDQRVARKLRGRRGQAVRRGVAAMGEKTDRRLADPARDQGGLRWQDVAHREVGIAPQQILGAVAQGQLDIDGRVRRAEPGQHGRQHGAADELARRQTYGAAQPALGAGGCAQQG